MRTPKTSESHTLSVTKTARYYTFGDFDAAIKDVWIVCHGYSQLAAGFIKYFDVLDNGTTIVVAPEALSLFYLNRFAAEKDEARKIGASWMTSENRLTEIQDHVDYLETLCRSIFERVDRSRVTFSVLGFSQGAATVSRWIVATDQKVDRLILWAGGIPPDLKLDANRAKFMVPELHLVIGQRDELIPDAAVTEQESRLAQHKIPYRLTRFDGGHHMAQRVLKQLSERGA